jgi:DNA helicase HerA-like ATPase
MDPSPADRSGSPQARLEGIGRVISVNGSQAAVELTARALREDNPAVAKFIGLKTQKAMIIGLITGVDEEPVHAAGGAGSVFRKVARLDLIGEFFSTDAGGVRFQRGFSEYPNIGDVALMLTENMLRLMYGTSEVGRAHIGNLQQNPNIQVQVDIDQLVSRHFAILGATGVGKSSGVVIILQKILETRPNLRIFLVDAHNEYGRCFGDQAHVLTPQNLHLPFWMFNFEEIVDVFFGGRPPVDEEVEVLAEVIPLAKAAYQYIRDGGDRHIVKKRGIRQNGFAPDTPVPYRIEDLVSLIDERMGKLENRSSRMTYHKLIRRIQTFRDHPRYTFMFENANVGGDTLADIVSGLFRLPTEGKPLTIMGLAGFPAEVVDAVVSVLCRMAFDFGVWSDGIAPLLFVCEEAHRYAPADRRAAVSEAAANLLSFVPSLATREVFTFGAGVALPTCMRFQELPRELRPNNDAAGITRSDASGNFDRDLVESVIGRWRSATMGFRLTDEDMQELGAPTDAPAPAPAVAPTVAPVSRPQTTPPLTGLRAEALRPSVLRKQLFES